MARTQLLREFRVHRQRKKAGRGRDPVVLHDTRAVVQRRGWLKVAQYEIVGEQSLERDAPLDVVAQPDLALDRDNRADSLRREHVRGNDQFLNRFLGRFWLGKVPEE